jgi:pseudouridine kinase
MGTSPINAPRIAVVGSVFLDVIYDRRLDESEAEPVYKFSGGIGRNIAENIGWMGLRPRLITLLTPDSLGERVAVDLANAGVDLAAKYVRSGIGVYRAFFRMGELEQYDIKQPLIERMDWPFVRKQLRGVSHVVVETGLNRGMMRALLLHCQKHDIRAYGIPTRLHEIAAEQQLAIISRLDCVIMNRSEAEAILGRSISGGDGSMKAVAELQRLGVRQAVITLGSQGVAAADEGSLPAVYATGSANVVSALGCGDAFAAGFVASSAVERAFAVSIEAGLKLARWTVEVPGPVSARSGIGLLDCEGQKSRMNSWSDGASLRRHSS